MSLRKMLLKLAEKKAPVIDDDEEDNFRRRASGATKGKRARRQVFKDSDSEDETIAKKSKKATQTSKKPPQTSKKPQPKMSQTTPQRTVSTRSSPAKKNTLSSPSLKNPTSTQLRRSPRKTASPSTKKKQKLTTIFDFFGSAPITRTYRPEADSGSISGKDKKTSNDDGKKKEDTELEVKEEEEVGMEFDKITKAMAVLEEDQAAARRKEVLAHEDEEFVRTLKEEDSLHGQVNIGSQQPLKKAKLKLERVKINSSSSTEQDMLSTDMTTPSKASCAQKRARSITPRMAKSVSPRTSDEQKLKRTDSYIKYLNRSGPQHPGSKDIPEGAENCLQGLTFVLTGVLDSLEREEADKMIQKYGGRVTGSVSGRTNYVVAGVDAGVSKLSKARANSTPIIDEDGLLELIRSRPTTPSRKWTKKGGTCTSSSAKKKGTSAKMTKISSSRQRDSSDSILPDSCRDSTPAQTESLGTSMSRTMEIEGCVVEKAGAPDRGTAEPERLLWVDKYRPISTKQLVGKKGVASNASKLSKWLQNWQGNHIGGVTKSGKTASRSASGKEKSSHKAVLLAGPPGVGKTTTAQLVCKEAGFSYVEMNASSCRSKSALHQEVASQLGSLSLTAFMSHRSGCEARGERRALIMDEVDGMDGNADRGGIAELISLIKSSCIPIICICNDRQSAKMRSLANHCYLLTFSPPKVEQIRGAMMSICFREKIKIEPQALMEIIMASGQDMRQVLHNLSLWSASDELDAPLKVGVVKGVAAPKLKMNPFDVVRKVFEPFEGGQELSLQEKSELFFHDYSMSSLFVQENYVRARPSLAEGNALQKLKCVALAADSLCQGDLVEQLIRRQSRWGLLPFQSFLSSVIPGEHMKGTSCGRPMFPRWLGMHSKTTSNSRSLQELQQHTRLVASCNKTEFGMDYLPILCSRLTEPIITKGAEGIPDVIAIMHQYDLNREDWDSMVTMSHYSGRPEIAIPSKVKASFTRAFNKRCHLSHHSIASAGKKRAADAGHYGTHVEEEGGEEVSDAPPSSDAPVPVTKKGTKQAS